MYPHVGEGGFSLTDELRLDSRVVLEEFAGDGEAFAVDEVCWGSAKVGLDCCPNCQHGAWETPVPVVWAFVAKCNEGLFESSMEALHHAVCFRMVWRCRQSLDAPDVSELFKSV